MMLVGNQSAGAASGRKPAVQHPAAPDSHGILIEFDEDQCGRRARAVGF